MAYVITQHCCNDAICVEVCPVNCISPTPNDSQYIKAEMLYIDPNRCTDCEACVEVCPVGAIHRREELPEHLARYAEINADYFQATAAGEDSLER
jgi:ferredoxin--NADP+ reductase